MSAGSRILCLTGAECGGKSTLARALADAHGAPLVSEAARDRLDDQRRYDARDLLAIARAQLAEERRTIGLGAPWIICDTDLLVIRVWWRARFGPLPVWLRQAVAELPPRLYLLARPDVPFVRDRLRESGGRRAGLHRRYRWLLRAGPHPYVELSGSLGARLAWVRRRLPQLLAATAPVPMDAEQSRPGARMTRCA